MSTEKPTLYVPPPAPPKNLCPICGTPTYSLGGIHPQCAIQQADQPRVARLRAAKVAMPKPKKAVQTNWRKRCPKCGSQLHVNRKACACGHEFPARK